MPFVRLHTKLIAAFLVFILIPIYGIGIYTYREFEHLLTRQIAASTSERLQQVNRNMEREFRGMVNAYNSLTLDKNVLNVLRNPPSSARDTINRIDQMDQKFLEISTTLISNPVYLALIDNQGNYYTNWAQTPETYERIRKSDWYGEAISRNGFMVWEMNHDNYVHRSGEKLVTLAMQIKDRDFGQVIGMLIISEPVQPFLDMLGMKNNRLKNLGFIMDRKGNFMGEDPAGIAKVYPSIESRLSNKEATFSGDVHGDRVEVFTNYISLSEWLVVQVIPHKQIFNPIRQVRNIATMTLMISMILFIAIIVGISTIFTRSLRLLHIGMKQVEAGNLDVSFAVRSRDEVGWLGKNLNTMLKKLKHQLTNEIVLERKKEQAKLEALQAQINPHFLYNTINTIKWMSILKGTESITEMLVSLGHLLNMSIHRGQETITLEEDLRNVRYFLTIQKHRFGDTIRIEEHIDPATLDCMVPKLSLQPLVENVYQHGLFINGGLLAIRSRIESDTLVIEVADNGAGPSPDKLDEIRRSIADNTLSGIGLTNVHHRIRMMCGPPYGLDFERDDTNGMTCASIRLPVRRNNDGDSDRRD